jgi:hypothetical protein
MFLASSAVELRYRPLGKRYGALDKRGHLLLYLLCRFS